MADPNDRVPQNVPGRFFVDTSCIFCELCELTAPSVFKEDQENGWAYVYHQPETKEELAAASEALEGCPTESIGAEGYDPEWRALQVPRSNEKEANQTPEPTRASAGLRTKPESRVAHL